MGLKKKTGILMLLLGMAAAAVVVWYVLLSAGKDSSHLDGTFVSLPGVVTEREAA